VIFKVLLSKRKFVTYFCAKYTVERFIKFQDTNKQLQH